MGIPEGGNDSFDDEIDDLDDESLDASLDTRHLDVADLEDMPLTRTNQTNVGASSSTLPLSEDSLPRVVAALDASELKEQLTAAARLRRLLSADDPPIKEAVGRGAVPRLVELLRRDSSPRLQLEAAWALTNIASGAPEHVRAVVDGGALTPLCRLLRASDSAVREQAAWALGNIAGDGAKMRDKVLVAGALAPLVRTLRDAGTAAMQTSTQTITDKNDQLIHDGDHEQLISGGGSLPLAALRTCVWALSNLVRGKPAPPLSKVQSALPILAELTKVDDEEVLTDVCWALSYLGERSEGVDAVIETGVCTRLSGLLAASSPSVQKSALHAVGNIVAGSQIQAQAALDGGALPLLTLLLCSPDAEVERLAAWAISNVTAGSSDQIQAVIDHHAIPPLLKLLKSPSRAVRKEAAFAIVNVTTSPWPQHTHRLVQQGVIEPLCELLSLNEPTDIITVTLEGLQNILKVGETYKLSCDSRGTSSNSSSSSLSMNDEESLSDKSIQDRVDIAGKAKILELCEAHKNQNDNIYNISIGLLKTYFNINKNEVLNKNDESSSSSNSNNSFSNIENGDIKSNTQLDSKISNLVNIDNRSNIDNVVNHGRKGKTISNIQSDGDDTSLNNHGSSKITSQTAPIHNQVIPSSSPVSSSGSSSTLAVAATTATTTTTTASSSSTSSIPSTSAASSTMTSTTANGQRVEFVVNIKNFTSRRNRGHPAGQYSEVFDGKKAGRWRLLSYTHGTVAGKDGEWLSLYVSSADVDELACKHRWSRTVDYSITLVHPTAMGINKKGGGNQSSSDKEGDGSVANLSVTRRHTSVVFRGVHNDYEWGCRDFLPSDQVAEQGFLLNDSLLVRVEVELRDDAAGQPLSVLTAPELKSHLAWAAENGLPRSCLACLTTFACNNGQAPDLGKGFGSTKANHTALTQHLAAASSPLVSATCSEEWGTPLHLACIGWRPGNSRVVTLLLDCGAPVDALNKHGETPLVLAAREGGQSSVVSTLLDRGGNPCLCSKGGWSPMSAAASRGRDDIVKLLARRGAPLEEVWPPLSALLEAAKAGHASTALTLLECGADPEVQDEKGSTALWILLEKNMTEAALCMVQKYHASVAQCSRERSKVQRAKLLLKHAQRRVVKKPNNNSSKSNDLKIKNMDEGRILTSGSVDFEEYLNEHDINEFLEDEGFNNSVDNDEEQDRQGGGGDRQRGGGKGGGMGGMGGRDFSDHYNLGLDSADVAALDLVKELEEEENKKESKSSKNKKKKEKAKLKKQQQFDKANKKKHDIELERKEKEEAKKKIEDEKRNQERRLFEEKERIRREAAKLEWHLKSMELEKESQQALSESLSKEYVEPKHQKQKSSKSRSSNENSGNNNNNTSSDSSSKKQQSQSNVEDAPGRDSSSRSRQKRSTPEDNNTVNSSSTSRTAPSTTSNATSSFSMAKLNEVKSMANPSNAAPTMSKPKTFPWNNSSMPITSDAGAFPQPSYTLQSTNGKVESSKSIGLNLHASPFPAPKMTSNNTNNNNNSSSSSSNNSGSNNSGGKVVSLESLAVPPKSVDATFDSFGSSSSSLEGVNWGLHTGVVVGQSSSNSINETDMLLGSMNLRDNNSNPLLNHDFNTNNNNVSSGSLNNDHGHIKEEDSLIDHETALIGLGQLGTLLKKHIRDLKTLYEIVNILSRNKHMDYANFLMMSESELINLERPSMNKAYVALLLEIQEEEVLSGVGMSFMDDVDDDGGSGGMGGSIGNQRETSRYNIGKGMDFLLGDDSVELDTLEHSRLNSLLPMDSSRLMKDQTLNFRDTLSLLEDDIPCQPEPPWKSILRYEIVKEMVSDMKSIEDSLLNKTNDKTNTSNIEATTTTNSSTSSGSSSGGSDNEVIDENMKNVPPGFVFVCSADTADEALAAGVFGLPGSHADDLDAAIGANTPIFLFNFSDGTLSGPWVADGRPSMNILPTAFSSPNRPTSRFPAQLRVMKPNTISTSAVSHDDHVQPSHGFLINNNTQFRSYPHIVLQLDDENLTFTSKLAGHWSWFGVPGPISIEHTRDILSKMYHRSNDLNINLITPLNHSNNESSSLINSSQRIGKSYIGKLLIMEWILSDKKQENDDEIIPNYSQQVLIKLIRLKMNKFLSINNIDNDNVNNWSMKIDLAVNQIAECCINARMRWISVEKEMKSKFNDENENVFNNHHIEVKVNESHVELIWKLKNDTTSTTLSDSNSMMMKKKNPGLNGNTIDKQPLSYSSITKPNSNDDGDDLLFNSLTSEFKTFINLKSYQYLFTCYNENGSNLNDSQFINDNLFHSHLFEIILYYETLGLSTISCDDQNGDISCKLHDKFSFFELCLPDLFIESAKFHFDAIPCFSCPMTLPSSNHQNCDGDSNLISGSLNHLSNNISSNNAASTSLLTLGTISYNSMFKCDKVFGSSGTFNTISSCLDHTGGGSYLLKIPNYLSLTQDVEESSINLNTLIEPMSQLLNNQQYPISFLVVMELSSNSNKKSMNMNDDDVTSTPLVPQLHPLLHPWLLKSVILDQVAYQIKELSSIMSTCSIHTSSTSGIFEERDVTGGQVVIMILQNEAGTRTWNPCDEALESLRKSLVPTSESDSSIFAQLNEGNSNKASTNSWAKIVRSGN